MGDIERDNGRYTTAPDHFANIAEALVTRSAAMPAYLAAVRDAYEKGRADAEQGAVEALRRVQATVNGGGDPKQRLRDIRGIVYDALSADLGGR